ncbi:5-oxoprolinase subunit PxpB [Bacillus marasmi]|uniref:5-oxoprolinase subunit PxpB n=1 Tax=Bacillus marasmi TaxID=1926279 RepID=UPI0011CBBA2F|nr:5-oxoprolinase subunit PxpB [Bacillus marasmi]
MEYHLQIISEQAILIDWGNEILEAKLHHIQSVASQLESHPFPWMIEYVPAYTTITIYFDPLKIWKLAPTHLLPAQYALQQIDQFLNTIETNQVTTPRTVIIPVFYGGEFGPDLAFVANHNGITSEEVINIHTSNDYIVHMVGFAPGFPYLGGLSEKIFAPRRNTPRLSIPAGSVGIAGGQTGVYPIESPGGWQVIGQTPLKLFRPTKEIPSLLQMGDIIKFKAISYDDFRNWEDDAHVDHP